MTMQPPQRGDGEPRVIQFGIAAFDAHLQEATAEYPITAADLVAELDDPGIPIDARGNSVALSTALEEVPRDEFESERDLKNALHPVFESYREKTNQGIAGRIRALLPF